MGECILILISDQKSLCCIYKMFAVQTGWRTPYWWALPNILIFTRFLWTVTVFYSTAHLNLSSPLQYFKSLFWTSAVLRFSFKCTTSKRNKPLKWFNYSYSYLKGKTEKHGTKRNTSESWLVPISSEKQKTWHTIALFFVTLCAGELILTSAFP